MNPLEQLRRRIVTAEEMRGLDEWTINHLGVATTALMETAGRVVAQHIVDTYGNDTSILVVFGPGHNGADGLVVGRVLTEWGLTVSLRSPLPETALSQLCHRQLRTCMKMNMDVALGAAASIEMSNRLVIVDALFGTGLGRAPAGMTLSWIKAINGCSAPVVAVDIPSGVCGTSGRVMGMAVKADSTVTFQCSKWGHWAFPGSAQRGMLLTKDIGVSGAGIAHLKVADRHILGAEWPACVLPDRPRDGHKGTFGHLGIMGGHSGMVGAAKLAGKASMRVGVGKCTVLCERRVADQLAAELETVMCAQEPAVDPTDNAFDEVSWTPEHDAYVLGCGLDPKRLGRRFATVARSALPKVLDAGALAWLAAQTAYTLGAECVLTPHPKEAAVLLGKTVSDVEQDRLGSIRELSEEFGCVVVLKGAYTLMTAPSHGVYLCPYGNPGMASAGMGDVLAGVIGGLMAQGLSAWDAARAGVIWHARAGDSACAHKGEYTMIATDVIENLATVTSC